MNQAKKMRLNDSAESLLSGRDREMENIETEIDLFDTTQDCTSGGNISPLSQMETDPTPRESNCDVVENTPEVNETNISSTVVVPVSTTLNDAPEDENNELLFKCKEDVEATCKMNVSYLIIKEKVRQGSLLTDADANKFAKLIMSPILACKPGVRLGKPHFVLLSNFVQEILSLDEDAKSIFFVPGDKPSGKLYYAYVELKRQLIQYGLRDKANYSKKPTEKLPECGVQESIDFLKCRNPDFNDVMKHWKLSFNYRFQMLKISTYTIANYLDDFPSLRDSNGIDLLCSDVDAFVEHTFPHAKDGIALFKSKCDVILSTVSEYNSKNPDVIGLLKLSENLGKPFIIQH